MLALYRCGRQVDALHAFRDFRAYLVEETGLEPTKQLQELEDDIIQQKDHLDFVSDVPAPASSAAVVASFPPELLGVGTVSVGRTADLEWLETLWSRAASTGTQAALVWGPAGIGKTHLLGEFAGRVHAGGAGVVYRAGGCGDPIPPLRNANGTLVVFDDLDALSELQVAQLITEVDCEAGDAPVLVVATRRSAPAEDLVGMVRSRALTGLSGEDVAAVLADIAGLDQPGLADAVLDETGGVPALVVAVAEQLREREVIARLDRALEQAGRAGTELDAAQEEIGATAFDRLRRGSGVGVLADGVCPYKGLASFDVRDAGAVLWSGSARRRPGGSSCAEPVRRGRRSLGEREVVVGPRRADPGVGGGRAPGKRGVGDDGLDAGRQADRVVRAEP